MSNPDVIFYNGRIYPRSDRRNTADGVAVWKGRVARLGSDREILGLRARSVKIVDLKGRVVIPGLSDSHIHLLGYGMFLRTLDLTKAVSVRNVLEAVTRVARARKRGSWIVGRGWDQEKLREGRFLNSRDLDLFTDYAVYLKRVCGHVAVANKLALSIAGIRRKTADPKGGRIERDPNTGEPTGVLKESALGLVEERIPLSDEVARSAITLASEKLLRLGITSLHCIIQDLQELRVLRLLKKQGKVRQSIYAILPARLLGSMPKSAFTRSFRDIRVGGVKVYLDGSLGARTAALKEPYSDESGSFGMMTTSPAELEEIVEQVSKLKLQLCIHSIGDRAVEAAVSAIENASSHETPAARHRIEHSSLTPPALLPRMRKIGIIPSIQPRFIFSDSWAVKRLGKRRSKFLYPFKSMLKAGLTLAAGSDAPVEAPNPFEGVWSAVQRPGLPKNERLTVAEALAAYTTGAAYASFSEKEYGTLEPGKRADMLVLDRDPFTCPTAELRNIKVLKTIVAGKIV